MNGAQSRKQSMAEACANVAVGYMVAILAQMAIFPMFGLYVALGDNLAIGGLFTIVSLVRSYALRRAFNRWLA